MGQNTSISWCQHTFSPWHGCVEVSPACDHCYARELDNRFQKEKHWGKDAPRRFFGDKHWAEPLKWDREAEKSGVRARVFCGSMCDVMEEYTGSADLVAETITESQAWLYRLIERTPNLDWLLLTKRPQNFRRFLPLAWLNAPRPNVWLMTTIESPEYYWRWKALADTPAAVRGISYEPALAPISLYDLRTAAVPDWLIAGDESGRGARPSQLAWYETLRDECRMFGVAFHMKQLCTKGKPMDFPMFPERLQVRQLPEATHAD